MTAPMWMTDCPTEEVLAAFVDDRLDAPTRLNVTEHLASCAECRENVLMATDFLQTEMPANLVHPTFGARRWIAPSAGLAAAAVVAVFLLRPPFLFAPNMNDVSAASESLSYRPALGRSSAELTYREAPSNKRGEVKASDRGKAKLLAIQAETHDPHVAGAAAYLTASKGSEFEDASASLREAYAKADDEEKDAIAVDYAAALIAAANWRAVGEEAALQEAFRLSDAAFHHEPTPQAAWNRALALEFLHKKDEAILAWGEYLDLDPDSKWANEARVRKTKLSNPDS
jgi:hypothetical protein